MYEGQRHSKSKLSRGRVASWKIHAFVSCYANSLGCYMSFVDYVTIGQEQCVRFIENSRVFVTFRKPKRKNNATKIRNRIHGNKQAK